MRAVYFIQETKNADLTMRQQQLLCLRAARRLRWYCCEAVFAEAGTETASLALRPGMQELLRSAADGEFDVLLIVDAEHLFCSQAEIEGLISTLLRSGVHTFCAKAATGWNQTADTGWCCRTTIRSTWMIGRASMFNLFCTLPALPAAKPQPIPLRCMKVPPLPVTPNRAVVYARTADRHVGVLETQYNSVLAAAREDGCIVVDAAIEHRPGSSLRKPGLLRLLKVIRKGEANVLYVQDLSRLHSSPFWLYLLFCWMQDHNAKIITTACDIRYSLHYDLHIEQKLLERAARKGRDVPWIV